ncbi:MAG TPA: nuclear transport factor 2 family protein [Dehalococcoidia bacterium]
MTAWEDVLAIRELTARYNHAIDEGRAEDWAATFVEDGVFEPSAGGRFEGRAALVEFARGFSSRFKVRHCTTDAVVEVDGDRATQTCYLILLDRADGVKIRASGVYHDTLTRTPDGWRFTHRRVEIDAPPARE